MLGIEWSHCDILADVHDLTALADVWPCSCDNASWWAFSTCADSLTTTLIRPTSMWMHWTTVHSNSILVCQRSLPLPLPRWDPVFVGLSRLHLSSFSLADLVLSWILEPPIIIIIIIITKTYKAPFTGFSGAVQSSVNNYTQKTNRKVLNTNKKLRLCLEFLAEAGTRWNQFNVRW